MTAGIIAASRRRVAVVTGPPVTDTFSGATIDGAKWPTVAGTTSIQAGRMRIDPPGGERHTAAVFDLTQYPVWIEIPTLPIAGNGTLKTRFWIADASITNAIQYGIEGNPRFLWSQGNGITAGVVASYSATDHRWLRLRLSAGNLLFEAAPDGLTWATLRTVPAPAWLTTSLVKVMTGVFQTGTTEANPGYAEYDNFNVVPA
jgi:hypothetical protein